MIRHMPPKAPVLIAAGGAAILITRWVFCKLLSRPKPSPSKSNPQRNPHQTALSQPLPRHAFPRRPPPPLAAAAALSVACGVQRGDILYSGVKIQSESQSFNAEQEEVLLDLHDAYMKLEEEAEVKKRLDAELSQVKEVLEAERESLQQVLDEMEDIGLEMQEGKERHEEVMEPYRSEIKHLLVLLSTGQVDESQPIPCPASHCRVLSPSLSPSTSPCSTPRHVSPSRETANAFFLDHRSSSSLQDLPETIMEADEQVMCEEEEVGEIVQEVELIQHRARRTESAMEGIAEVENEGMEADVEADTSQEESGAIEEEASIMEEEDAATYKEGALHEDGYAAYELAHVEQDRTAVCKEGSVAEDGAAVCVKAGKWADAKSGEEESIAPAGADSPSSCTTVSFKPPTPDPMPDILHKASSSFSPSSHSGSDEGENHNFEDADNDYVPDHEHDCGCHLCNNQPAHVGQNQQVRQPWNMYQVQQLDQCQQYITLSVEVPRDFLHGQALSPSLPPGTPPQYQEVPRGEPGRENVQPTLAASRSFTIFHAGSGVQRSTITCMRENGGLSFCREDGSVSFLRSDSVVFEVCGLEHMEAIRPDMPVEKLERLREQARHHLRMMEWRNKRQSRELTMVQEREAETTAEREQAEEELDVLLQELAEEQALHHKIEDSAAAEVARLRASLEKACRAK